MKSFLIGTLLSASIFPLAVTAQEASTIFPPGTRWKEVWTEAESPIDSTVANYYEIGDDTLVCGVDYKKVIVNEERSTILIREENLRVWLRTEEFAEDILLYNFNLDAENPIQMEYLCETDEGYVKKIESIDHDDLKTIKYLQHVYQYYHDSTHTYLMGIGCVATQRRNSALLGYKESEIVLPDTRFCKVLWMQRNGKEIFRSTNAEEWTTDLPTSICFINASLSSAAIYDLSGHSLDHEPERGVYIKDGRKYVK